MLILPPWLRTGASTAGGGGGGSFDYYISPTGSDSNDGLTTSTPWAITALNTKRATYSPSGVGKTIGLMDGTYSVNALIAAVGYYDNFALDVDGGTAGNPVVIKAVNARLAIIDGKSGAGVYGDPTTACAMCGHSGTTGHRGYVTFDGIVFRGTNRYGLRIGRYTDTGKTSGITIQNCEFTDFSATQVAGGTDNPGTRTLNIMQVELSNCDGHIVTNNKFHDNVGYAVNDGDHLNSIIQWISTNGTISNNTVINSGSIYGKEYGSGGMTIEKNYVDNSGLSGAVCAIQDFTTAPNTGSNGTTTIRYNVCIAPLPLDLNPTLSGDFGTPPTDAQVIYNNTLIAVTNGTAQFGARIQSASAGLSFYNNLVYNSGTVDISYIGALCCNTVAKNVIDYNLYPSSAVGWCLFTQASGYTTRTAYSTSATWKAALGADTNSLFTNTPGFAGTGSLAALYATPSGSSHNAGHAGGTSGGSTCNIGADANDGVTYLNIGSNF